MTWVEFILSFWHVDPVRWAVYATVVLYLLYVYVMRLKRLRRKNKLSLQQKIVGYPVALVAVVFDWAYNWTVGSAMYLELPHSWDELFTQRLQRALDEPDTYKGYRLQIAKWAKPLLNRHDKDHLE